MMRTKITTTLSIIFMLLVVGKLQFDHSQQQRKLNELQEQLSRMEQRNANLQDQWVAWQREKEQVSQGQNTTAKALQPPIAQTQNEQSMAEHLQYQQFRQLRQQLELIQFAIQQQNLVWAMERLTNIEQHMMEYFISDSLKQSLAQSLAKDKSQLIHYQHYQQQRLLQIDRILNQLQHQLEQEFKQPSMRYQAPEHASFWQRFWKIESASSANPELYQHRVLLKEIQLNLLVLKQSVLSQQPAEFEQQLQEIQHRLQYLPDSLSQPLNTQFTELSALQQVKLPQLSSLALLGQPVE